MFWIHAQCISMYEIRPNLPGPDMLQLYGLGTPMSVSQIWIEVNPPMPWLIQSTEVDHVQYKPAISHLFLGCIYMYIFFVFLSHFLWGILYGILHFCTSTIVIRGGFPPNLWAFPASSMRDVVDVCVAVASKVARGGAPWWVNYRIIPGRGYIDRFFTGLLY